MIEPIRKTVSSVTGAADSMFGDAVTGEGLQRSVADHAHRQTDGRPAVQDPVDHAPDLKHTRLLHRRFCPSTQGLLEPAPDVVRAPP